MQLEASSSQGLVGWLCWTTVTPQFCHQTLLAHARWGCRAFLQRLLRAITIAGMQSLCILLPVTSKGHPALEDCLRCLQELGNNLVAAPPAVDGAAGPSGGCGPQLSVCVGIDEGDALQACMPALQQCFPAGIPTTIRIFTRDELAAQRQRCAGAASICWMWNELARHAQLAFKPQWMLLLGDDTRVEPAGWPQLLAGTHMRSCCEGGRAACQCCIKRQAAGSARTTYAILLYQLPPLLGSAALCILPHASAEHAGKDPHLRCLALLDAADPGFPSFPAVASSPSGALWAHAAPRVCQPGRGPLPI